MTPLSARRAPLRALLLAVTLSALAACDGGTTEDAVITGDLAGQFQARPTFAPLASALALTGVDLSAAGPFTVFAPTEAALRYVGTDFSPVLFAEPQREILGRVLRHHVVAGRIAPDALADGATFTALDGATLTVRRIGPVVTVNGTTVDLARAVEADNGVAYPVADVLLDGIESEDRVALSPSLTTLALGLRTTNVVAEVAAQPRVTVLAPLNDAFAALGQASLSLLQDGGNREVYARLLRTHVLAGDVDLAARAGQTVTTVAGDVLPVTRDANGVLSVDGVRVLRAETTADGRFYVLARPLFAGLTLAQRLRLRADLSQFLRDTQLVTGLAALLADRDAPVTVFAPADALYAARSSNTEQTLRAFEQAALLRRTTGVHIVRGRYAPADLTNGLRLTALDGTVLTVQRSLDRIALGDAPLSNPVRLANGYLYGADAFVQPDVDLLDTVLLAGFPNFFLAVRSSGTEAEFRARARTAFVVPDAAISPLTRRPNAEIRTLIRRTATADYIPAFTGVLPRTFEALNGDVRRIAETTCSPRDPTCFPYVIDPFVSEGGNAVERPRFFQGRQTQDRTGVWHSLEEPEFRLVQGINGPGTP